MSRKKKRGRLANTRPPKSREETPKEGSDSARRYRTATICDRAAQNARVFNPFPMQNSQGLQPGNTFFTLNIVDIFQYLTGQKTGARQELRVKSSILSIS